MLFKPLLQLCVPLRGEVFQRLGILEGFEALPYAVAGGEEGVGVEGGCGVALCPEHLGEIFPPGVEGVGGGYQRGYCLAGVGAVGDYLVKEHSLLSYPVYIGGYAPAVAVAAQVVCPQAVYGYEQEVLHSLTFSPHSPGL